MLKIYILFAFSNNLSIRRQLLCLYWVDSNTELENYMPANPFYEKKNKKKISMDRALLFIDSLHMFLLETLIFRRARTFISKRIFYLKYLNKKCHKRIRWLQSKQQQKNYFLSFLHFNRSDLKKKAHRRK